LLCKLDNDSWLSGQHINDNIEWPKGQRVLVLLSFFAAYVAVLAADILLHFGTALDFFIRGYFYRGSFTIMLMFLPLVGKFIMTVSSLLTIKRSMELQEFIDTCKHDFRMLFWNISIFQLIR